MTMLIIILIAVLGFVIMTYNSLVAKAEAVENSKRQIDVQLDRRFKVFEGLINTVRKVMDYEQTVFKDIVKLRNEAQQARKSGNEQGQFAAEEQISKIASNINVVFEQYPQLNSLDNARQLQEEIVSTENKLSFSKQSYNDSVETYNTAKNSFFGSIVASKFPKLNKEFEYWQLSVEKAQQYDEMTAKL
jgi:LemA protein